MNPRDPATGAPLRAALQVANHLGHNAAIFLVGQSTAVCGYVVIGISQPQTDPVIVSRTVASTRSCRQASHAAQPGTATTISVFSGLRAPPVYRNDSLWLVDVSGAAPPATGSAITFRKSAFEIGRPHRVSFKKASCRATTVGPTTLRLPSTLSATRR